MDKQTELSNIFKEHFNSDSKITEAKCPVCDFFINDAQERFIKSYSMFSVADIIRITCPDCGTVFGPISILNGTAEALSSYYNILYQFYGEGDTLAYQIQTLGLLKPDKNKVYLNYACGKWEEGIGKVLSRGFNVYGYDPSFKSKCVNIIQDKNLLKSKYDGLFSHNFIEHLQDPVKQFMEWNSLLNVGSEMIHTGQYTYNIPQTNFHLIYLTEKALNILCEKTGFILDCYSDTMAKFTKIK
jgi:hypothetical protein